MFEPTEAQIAKVLEKYTPRQIAIAYLRANHRAASKERAENAADDIVSFLTGKRKK